MPIVTAAPGSRHAPAAAGPLVAELLGSGFPSAELVAAAAALVPEYVPVKRPGTRRLLHWVTVSPGVIQGSVTGWDGPAAHDATRGDVRVWSAKSRANFRRRLGTLDYAPLFALGMPVMITLTYPGNDADGSARWLDAAPDAATTSRHLDNFRRAYVRTFGPLVGIWKREFQGRGAPHFHLLVPLPHGVRIEDMREWAKATWSRIVTRGRGLPVEVVADHRVAGAAVDRDEGLRMKDPRRLGVYFLKAGQGSTKEYQHAVPGEWATSGRFWGVWGLEPVEATVKVCSHDFARLRRLQRRYDRSRGFTVRASRSRGSGGWGSYNDAPAWFSQAWRWLEVVRACDCYDVAGGESDGES